MAYKNRKSTCTSVDHCESVDRICKVLMYYEHTNYSGDSDELLIRFFEDECGYVDLLNDYGHIIYHHLDLNRQQANLDFEKINIKITELITCNIECCAKYARNNRNRQELDPTRSFETKDINVWYYYDMLDAIHCNLIHSYDTGFRVNYNQLSLNKTQSTHSTHSTFNEDEIEKDINMSHDSVMETLNTVVQTKKTLLRKLRGFDQRIHSKYKTNFCHAIGDLMKHKGTNTKLNELNIFLEQCNMEYNDLYDLNVFIQTQKYDTVSIIQDIETPNNSNIYQYLVNNNHQNQLYFKHIQNFMMNNVNNTTKDNTNLDAKQQDVNDRKQQEINTFSFGYRFYYWNYYKNNDEEDYLHNIGIKYSNMYVS
eukprot:130036_1